MPGAALGVLREGVATTAYFGVADVTTDEPVSSDTRFSVGSLTKTMVATVIIRLAQAGKLSLDDSVATHIPELRGSGWGDDADVRDLLANRSGLPLLAGLEFGFEESRNEGDDGLSRLITDLASAGPPVSFWSYSNVGWCLLGRVIETVTGQPWAAAMQQGLDSLRETTFATGAASKSQVSGHKITPDGPVPVEPLIAPAYAGAGIGTVATVTDLLRFASLHLEDPSLAQMREAHADVPITGWLDAWCLGMARFDWPGGPVWGWDGVVNGERSFMRLLPEHDAAVVLMTNGSTGRAVYRSLIAELMDTMFGISVPPLALEPIPGAAGDLSRFAGVYAWPDYRLEVKAERGRLVISNDEGTKEVLPLDDRTLLVDPTDPDNPTMTFGSYDESGRPQVLYEMLWGHPRLAG